ncbi:MAG: ABC transporter permease [Chloroflexota bacterium]
MTELLQDVLTTAFIVSLFATTIRLATPILLAALGELITERAGILNLGVEGMMLMGAFTGFIVAYFTESLALGYIMAAVGGGVLALLMAFLATTLKVDQTISGLAINLLASGMTFYLYRVSTQDIATQTLANVRITETLHIPYLASIPVLGPVLFQQHLLTYLAFASVLLIHFFLYRTTYGLELRCLGENPRAVDMKGVPVGQRQTMAVLFGGLMAGLGGGFLTLSSAGLFVPDITAGRGWIAIAIIIFGNWQPIRILWATLFFGLLDSLQLQLQGVGVQLPYQLLLALPYILTIVALIVSRTRSAAPAALGVPYIRE